MQFLWARRALPLFRENSKFCQEASSFFWRHLCHERSIYSKTTGQGQFFDDRWCLSQLLLSGVKLLNLLSLSSMLWQNKPDWLSLSMHFSPVYFLPESQEENTTMLHSQLFWNFYWRHRIHHSVGKLLALTGKQLARLKRFLILTESQCQRNNVWSLMGRFVSAAAYTTSIGSARNALSRASRIFRLKFKPRSIKCEQSLNFSSLLSDKVEKDLWSLKIEKKKNHESFFLNLCPQNVNLH